MICTVVVCTAVDAVYDVRPKSRKVPLLNIGSNQKNYLHFYNELFWVSTFTANHYTQVKDPKKNKAVILLSHIPLAQVERFELKMLQGDDPQIEVSDATHRDPFLVQHWQGRFFNIRQKVECYECLPLKIVQLVFCDCKTKLKR